MGATPGAPRTCSGNRELSNKRRDSECPEATLGCASEQLRMRCRKSRGPARVNTASGQQSWDQDRIWVHTQDGQVWIHQAPLPLSHPLHTGNTTDGVYLNSHVSVLSGQHGVSKYRHSSCSELCTVLLFPLKKYHDFYMTEIIS